MILPTQIKFGLMLFTFLQIAFQVVLIIQAQVDCNKVPFLVVVTFF